MQALLLTGKNKLSIQQVKSPIPKEDEILIRIEITGIGGSEYLGYNNPGIRRLPNIMGHGICGLAEKSKRIAIYPLISCAKCEYCKMNLAQLCSDWKMIGVHLNGGFAEQIAVSKELVFEIPASLSWEQASFIEPFANSINAWEISKAQSIDKVLIIGAGGLGLGLAACAKYDKHDKTFVLETSTERRKAAIELGAKTTELTNDSFDIVFDTVGSTETRSKAIELVKRNGKIIFLGFAMAEQVINFSELIRKLAGYTKTKWVKNLDFKNVEQQLKDYLKDDFKIIKAALRPNGV